MLDAKIRGRGARVAVALVVGEEPLMRSLAAYMLKEIGYRVVEAATREEALAIADASAEFDVALVDVESAESCADLARRLRASWPRLPIVLTGRGERIAEGWGEDRRVAAIGKPYDVRGLTLALSKAGAALRRQSAPAPA